MLEIDDTDSLLEDICNRIGNKYGGYHTISAGIIDGENCPEISFHVGDKKQMRIQPLTGEAFEGTGIVFKVLVGSKRSVVLNENNEEIYTFDDITKDLLFGKSI